MEFMLLELNDCDELRLLFLPVLPFTLKLNKK
jgi:hypothetical protein